MKKIFALCIIMICSNWIHAQQTSYRSIALDSTEVTRVAPMISNDEDFNVLLSTAINPKWIAAQYVGFVDTLLNNSYKKINDSTYEIDVYNPCKDIFLVNYGKRKEGAGILLGDFSEAKEENFIINYFDGSQHLNYSSWSYNPFFYKFSQFDGKKDIGRIFLFKYFFSKPILAITTTKDYMIKRKMQFPSASFLSFIKMKDRFKVDSSFSLNNKGILFVFDHFGRYARRDQNDYLKYRLDNDSDWSFTALSYSPSILLENLSSGKHTLYVAYNVMKGQDAAILEYHFSIAPN